MTQTIKQAVLGVFLLGLCALALYLNRGTTVEVEGKAAEKWAADVAVEHGFTDVTHTFEIFGQCRDCTVS